MKYFHILLGKRVCYFLNNTNSIEKEFSFAKIKEIN